MKSVPKRIAAAFAAASVSQRALALLVSLTARAVAVVACIGEEGAMEFLRRRNATLEAGLGKPLDYRDLTASELTVLISVAAVSAVLPAVRFWEFLKTTTSRS